MAGITLPDATGPTGVRVYAIGDIHGRLDLLTRMHDVIDSDRARHPDKDWRIVYLGDYVDRGTQSRGVIESLIERCRDPRARALAGNHDVGFLEFLADPARDGLFARFGGRETARSYGIELDFGEAFERNAHELRHAVPRSHTHFLAALTFSAVFGDFFFCHAGIRPGIAMQDQKVDDLIWIRKEFHSHREPFTHVVVHGHTPVAEPEVLGNRINIDTGAFQTGVLTALVIDGLEKTIVQVLDLEA